MNAPHLGLAVAAVIACSGLAWATQAVPMMRPSSGCRAATIATGRRIEQQIVVDGTTREYILDVPTTLTAGGPAPLLFDFHGLGHSGSGVWRVSQFRALAEDQRFITVYPNGAAVHFEHKGRVYDGTGWELGVDPANRDLRFVVAMLDRLERDYCIDRNRIYATGFSNGAYFSHLLACTMADRFAAIAPVSGGKRPSPCAPARPVPALIHHGRQDDVIDIGDGRAARDSWAESNGCGASVDVGEACRQYTGCRDGAEVEYCEGDFAHRWPVGATERIWEFLRRHALPDQPEHESLSVEPSSADHHVPANQLH